MLLAPECERPAPSTIADIPDDPIFPIDRASRANVGALVMDRRGTLPRLRPATTASQSPGAEACVDAIQGRVETPVPGAVEGAVRAAVEEIPLHRLRGTQF